MLLILNKSLRDENRGICLSGYKQLLKNLLKRIRGSYGNDTY